MPRIGSVGRVASGWWSVTREETPRVQTHQPQATSLAASLIRRVLHAATVGSCRGGRNRFPGHHRIKRGLHVVSGYFDVGQIGTPLVINSPFVDERSVRVDDVHVRRGLGTIEASYFAVRIQQQRRSSNSVIGSNLIQLFRWIIPLLTRGGRINREPNHSLRGVRLLKGLHISGFVVFPNERAIRLIPFQHHKLPLEICQTARLPICVRQSKVWGGFSNFYLREAQTGCRSKQSTSD